MGIETIGKQIAILRKEKGVKQEEDCKLRRSQRSSRIKMGKRRRTRCRAAPENRGFLFGVDRFSLRQKNTRLRRYSVGAYEEDCGSSEDDKVKTAFGVCWNIERALVSQNEYKSDDGITEYEKKIGENGQRYSSAMFDGGFTNMGIGNMRRYFLLVSDPESTDEAYFDGIDYPAFFRDMADKDFFDAMVLLHRMEKAKRSPPHCLRKSSALTPLRQARF